MFNIFSVMAFFSARFVPLFVLVSSEVITISNKENITCLLTKESVNGALYIWPPIYHQNGSMVNIKRPLVEIDNWGRDDWDVINKVDYKSHFAPVTDIRWEAYDLATGTSFKVEPLFSVSACSINRVNNSFLLNKDLFVLTSHRKTTDSKEFCSWIHYSVCTDTIVKNIQDKTWTERRQSSNNSNFDIHVLSSNNIVKFHKNQFRYSETETTHPGKRSYINLINVTNSSTLCLAMFVAVDKLCQLDVTIESGGKSISKSIFGFNDVFSSAIKYWKRVEIKFGYYSGSGKLLFLRRKPYSSYHCFWAIDCIHLCKPGIDTYQITRPGDNRQDYICRTLDNRNHNNSAFCNNTEYLDTGCKLKCKDVMGDNYPYCDSHQICLENGDCKCVSGHTNANCLSSHTFESTNQTDACGDIHKNCTAYSSSGESLLYIFGTLMVAFFIACMYFMYKSRLSFRTNFRRCFFHSEQEINLEPIEQVELRTKMCVVVDFAKYKSEVLEKFVDSSRNCEPWKNVNEKYICKVQVSISDDDYINGTLKTYLIYDGPGYGDDFWKVIIQDDIQTIVVTSEETPSTLKDPSASYYFEKVKTVHCECYYIVTYLLYLNEHQREIDFYHLRWSDIDATYLYPSKILPLVKQIFKISIRSTVPFMIKSTDDNLSGTLIACDVALHFAEIKNAVSFFQIFQYLSKQRANIITDQNYYILVHSTIFQYLLEEWCIVKNQKNGEVYSSPISQVSLSLRVVVREDKPVHQFLIDKQTNSTSIKAFWSRVAVEDIEFIFFVDPLPEQFQLWPCIKSDDNSKIEVKKLLDPSEYCHCYSLNRVSLKVTYKKVNVPKCMEVGLVELNDSQPKALLKTVQDIRRIFPKKRFLLSYRTSIKTTLLIVALLSFEESIYLM